MQIEAHAPHKKSPWYHHLTLEVSVGVPLYEKVTARNGEGFQVGEETALDFTIAMSYFLHEKVALGLAITPGYVVQVHKEPGAAEEGGKEKSRIRLATQPNVRYFPIKNLYIRGGVFVPILPDPNVGLNAGLGVIFGKRLKGFLEFSTPVSFVGEHATFATVLDLGFELHLFGGH